MTPFSYATPETLDAAFQALVPGSKILAGGQSLLLALKERQARPTAIVSLAGLQQLRGITSSMDGGLVIGPATTYARLAKAQLPSWYAMLAKVAGGLADRSVRNLGSIGGGVCQADPRYDMPVFCAAVEARFTLGSSAGQRVLEASEFFNMAGGTTIAADEILTAITLPRQDVWSHVAFEKFCFRTFEAATVNVTAAVQLDTTGKIVRLRIAVGAVAKAPSIAGRATAELIGRSLTDIDVAALAANVSEEVLPIATAGTRHRKYQSELTISLVRRAMVELQNGDKNI